MKTIYLIGFRAAGKTTVGRALAEKLGWDFFDLDSLWEKRTGETINEFVEKNGLEKFRRGEESILSEMEAVATGPHRVVATGGGLVDWAPSVGLLLRAAAPKIYLEVPEEELWARLQRQPERRKIGDLHSFEQMKNLLQSRRVIYEKIATYRVPSRDITGALELIEDIAKRL